MWKIILIIGIFLFHFILRYFNLFNHDYVGPDTGYHLRRIDVYKKKSWKDSITNSYPIEEYDFPEPIEKTIGPRHNTHVYYPYFFHVFMKFFPKKQKYSQIIIILIDWLTALILFYFSYSLFGFNIAIISTFIYVINPTNILNSCLITPRPFANLLVVSIMLFSFKYISSGLIIYYILIVILIAVLYNTHKLGTQTIVVLILTIGILYDIELIFTLPFSFLLITIVTRNEYFKVLKWHIINLSYYIPHNISLKKNMRELAYSFVGSPPLIVIFWSIINLDFFLYNSAFIEFLHLWFIILLFLSFIWIWGASYRYLNFATFPLSIIFVSIYIENFLILLLIIISSILISIKIIRMFSKSPRVVEGELKDINKCIKAYKSKSDEEKSILIKASQERYLHQLAFLTRDKVFHRNDKNILPRLIPILLKEEYQPYIITNGSQDIPKNKKFSYKNIYKKGSWTLLKVQNN